MSWLFFCVFACVLDRTGQSVATTMRKEIVDNKNRLGQLNKEAHRIDDRVSQIEELTRSRGKNEIMKMENLDDLRVEVANLRNDLESFSNNYQKTSNYAEGMASDVDFRLRFLESRAKNLEKQLDISTPAPPKLPTSKVDPKEPSSAKQAAAKKKSTSSTSETQQDLSPKELVKKAEDFLKQGKDKIAEKYLDRFLQSHPKDKLVPKVLYRRAEAAFNRGDYSVAAKRFQQVIEKNKQGKWAPYALLRQGECFEKLKGMKQARFFYEDVVSLYPNSKAAKEAKQKLKKK